MDFARFFRRSDGAILTEMLVAALFFVAIGLVVIEYAQTRKTAPVVELQTDPGPPRLIPAR